MSIKDNYTKALLSGKCDRCGLGSETFSGSYFNTEILCSACRTKERAHPAFAEAMAAEHRQVERGHYNFPGVGLPPDLVVKKL